MNPLTLLCRTCNEEFGLAYFGNHWVIPPSLEKLVHGRSGNAFHCVHIDFATPMPMTVLDGPLPRKVRRRLGLVPFRWRPQ